jgi:hypothetical protein
MGAAVAVLLRFATVLSGERAIEAYLIRLVMAAVAAKATWRSGSGDGPLLIRPGILGVLLPLSAWQISLGAVWFFADA